MTTVGLRGCGNLLASQASMPRMSQVLKEGNTYRLFFPMYVAPDGVKDILTVSGWGRALDGEKLDNLYYIPYEEGVDFEMGTTGRPQDLTPLVSYEKMGRVLYDADYEHEVSTERVLAKVNAEQMGEPLDEKTLSVALDKLHTMYYGDNTVTPKVNPSKQRLIGSLRPSIYTEVVVVRVDTTTGHPDMSTVTLASLTLNQKRITQLTAIFNDKNYRIHDDFFEVGYAYLGKDKASAGNAASFQGISNDTSFAKCSDVWNALAEQVKAKLAPNDEVMLDRVPDRRRKVTPKEVISATKKYVSGKRVLFTHVNVEAENFSWAAEAFAETGLGMDNTKFAEQVRAEVERLQKERDAKSSVSESVEDSTISTEQTEQLQAAKTLDDLAKVDGLDDILGADLDDIQ